MIIWSYYWIYFCKWFYSDVLSYARSLFCRSCSHSSHPNEIWHFIRPVEQFCRWDLYNPSSWASCYRPLIFWSFLEPQAPLVLHRTTWEMGAWWSTTSWDVCRGWRLDICRLGPDHQKGSWWTNPYGWQALSSSECQPSLYRSLSLRIWDQKELVVLSTGSLFRFDSTSSAQETWAYPWSSPRSYTQSSKHQQPWSTSWTQVKFMEPDTIWSQCSQSAPAAVHLHLPPTWSARSRIF